MGLAHDKYTQQSGDYAMPNFRYLGDGATLLLSLPSFGNLA